MTRIVLVHGAWHGASSWGPLEAELRGRGRDVLAVDLPADRPGTGAAGYADAVLAALEPLRDGERVLLVGHSLGGLTVPVVAERLGAERVAALVLVAALVPLPGSSFNAQVRAEPGIMARGFGRGQQRHDDGTTSWPAADAATGLYRGVAEELGTGGEAAVAAAVARLRRQAWDVGSEVTPLRRWPDVRTVTVVCAQDRVVDPERLRGRATALGSEVVELPGGHFPMLTRPAELADVLERAAATP